MNVLILGPDASSTAQGEPFFAPGAMLPNGESIFVRLLHTLRDAGITKVMVSAGAHNAALDQLAAQGDVKGLHLQFVPGDNGAAIGSLADLLAARNTLDTEKPLLVMKAGLVLTAPMLAAFRSNPNPFACCVDKTKPAPQPSYLAQLDMERIIQIAPGLSGAGSFAMPPLYKLDAAALDALCGIGRAPQNAGLELEQALGMLLRDGMVCKGVFPQNLGCYAAEPIDAQNAAAVALEYAQADHASQVLVNEPSGILHIGALLKRARAKKPLLVCGNFYEQLPVAHILSHLGITPALFQRTAGAAYSQVVEGVERFRQAGCDVVISVGGGATMDVAKAIALFAPAGLGETHWPPQPPAGTHVRHLAIPTTAGSGSECSSRAVLYHNSQKLLLHHESMLPRYVVLDANLLIPLPEYPRVCALYEAIANGLDVLCSTTATGEQLAIADNATSILLRNMRRYLAQDARGAEVVLRAAHSTGLAAGLLADSLFQAIASPLESMFRVPYGHAVAWCVPHVVAFMLSYPCPVPNLDMGLRRLLQRRRSGHFLLSAPFAPWRMPPLAHNPVHAAQALTDAVLATPPKTTLFPMEREPLNQLYTAILDGRPAYAVPPPEELSNAGLLNAVPQAKV